MWTKEIARKLKILVNHRDYVVYFLDSIPVFKLDLADDIPNSDKYGVVYGWFGDGDTALKLDDHKPTDFTIYKKLESWI